MSNIIDDYFEAKVKVHKLMGYVPNWVEIPMEDERSMHWMIIGSEENGYVAYSPEQFTEQNIIDGNMLYGGPIYTQRHLPKYVYRSEDYVMIAIDTLTDGNKFLMIFDSKLECTDENLKNIHKKHW